MPPKKKVAPKAKDAGDIIRIFQAYDTNGDKVITRDELGAVLKKLDSSWTDRQVQLLLKDIDQNHDGRIDYEEFVAWIMSTGRGGDKRQALKQAAEKQIKETGASGAASSGEAAKDAAAATDAAAASGGGVASSVDSAEMDAALEELFKFYDLDEDGEMERIELLEGEEKRLGQLDFPIVVRKATIQWFRDAGATGNAVDGLFLTKEKWKVAMKAKAVEGAKEAEDAALQDPLAWLRETYKKLWELNAPKPGAGGGGGGDEEGRDAVLEPPDWLKPGAAPLTISFMEVSDKISESVKWQKNILICSSGKDEVETFINYRNFLLVDGKAVVSRVFGLKNQTMAEAQADAKHALESAMNCHGFCKQIHFRLNNAALDFSRFCCDGFPPEVFDRQAWTIDEAFKRGFFQKDHKMMLEMDDRWNNFNIVITSKFDLEGANDFLKDKIPNYDKLGILLVDPATIS